MSNMENKTSSASFIRLLYSYCSERPNSSVGSKNAQHWLFMVPSNLHTEDGEKSSFLNRHSILSTDYILLSVLQIIQENRQQIIKIIKPLKIPKHTATLQHLCQGNTWVQTIWFTNFLLRFNKEKKRHCLELNMSLVNHPYRSALSFFSLFHT